ncbi:hypothetical protein BDY19DRAFT_993198 [Irpex rosettiformis]|uniref:Uncharacterized protein n=1 Tax=Irpex rosettiformis TaxID=378272 RepID=A0ACB8U683_9APHY|nr:hypothetical protein BDY19DRAFT_993198 [Irpex rosettiformis]
MGDNGITNVNTNVTANANTRPKTVSEAATKRLLMNSGNIYRVEVTNAAYTNRVITDIVAADGTGNPPIFGVTDIEEEPQVWEYDSFKQTIKNKKTGLYTYPEDMKKGARILERKAAYAWDVEDQDGGLHSIGSSDDKLYWALTDGSNWTPITLQAGTRNDDSWKWAFNKV